MARRAVSVREAPLILLYGFVVRDYCGRPIERGRLPESFVQVVRYVSMAVFRPLATYVWPAGMR